jgi:hypothetical protein
MKDSPEKISPLRRRMIVDMRMRKLSTMTQSSYIRAVRQFAGHLGRSPDTARDEDLRRNQLHCVDRGVSPITLNATIPGLGSFFEVTLKRPELLAKMSYVRVARTLPVVLSREVASRLIESASTLKHRTALSVAYGLISPARPRGFLPRGLPNPCPIGSTSLDSCAHAGRRRTILNDSISGPCRTLSAVLSSSRVGYERKK